MIPNGTVVTELDTDRSNSLGRCITRKSHRRTHKSSHHDSDSLDESTSEEMGLHPRRCSSPLRSLRTAKHDRSVTVASSEGERPQFRVDVRAVSVDEPGKDAADRTGRRFNSSQPDDVAAHLPQTEPLPTSDEIAQQLSSSRSGIHSRIHRRVPPTVVMASCRPIDTSRIEVFSRKTIAMANSRLDCRRISGHRRCRLRTNHAIRCQ